MASLLASGASVAPATLSSRSVGSKASLRAQAPRGKQGRALSVSTKAAASSGFQLTIANDNLVQKGTTVKFLTEKECALGVAFYPDVAYNGEGGYAQGSVTATFDDKLALSFDANNISIPTVDNTTGDVLGIPLHPLLKAEIVPKSIEGFLERRTGKVELQIDGEVIPGVRPVYTSAPIKITATLTTETTWGAVRSARGKRLDSEGRCVLVGVARAPPTTDPIISAALMLPTDILILLQCRFEFTK